MSCVFRWFVAGVVTLLMVSCSPGARPADKPASTPSTGAAQAHTAVPTVLILDASGSMTTPDAPGPRIDAAKNAAKALVADLPDDAHLGLVTYGTKTDSSPQAQTAGCQDVTTVVPLGPLDRQALNTAIDSLAPSGYTPISLALEHATAQLPTDGAKPAIVLVSDGEDTCGRPPCDVAAQLHAQHPGLAISTIGFRTDGPASDQLSCIANTTGGMFVQASNAKQLAARLIATQDVQTARASLSSTGSNGIDLGTSATDIRKANHDFPDVASSGRVVVTWRDCDYTFLDGILDTIAPHDGGRTIDGITSGSKVSDAVEFYGQPLGPVEQDTGKDWLTFLADKDKNFAYRMAIDGYNSTGTNTTGTITRITLCRCAPAPAPSGPPVATFEGYGPIKIGMTKDEAAAAMGGQPTENHYYSCSVLNDGRGQQALTVWINDGTGRVTGIETPPGTATDRGVGDGSSPDEIKAAYGAPEFTIEDGYVGGQGSEAVNVRNQKGGLMNFGISSDTPGERNLPQLVGPGRARGVNPALVPQIVPRKQQISRSARCGRRKFAEVS